MSPSTKIKVIELYSVSPPPGSVPATSLPLTFLDIPWLPFSPGQPLFFYDFPISTIQFTQTILPNLNHSLSFTLQYFFPFAGKLVVPPKPNKPSILYTEGDSISVTVAESDGDFSYLSGNSARKFQDLHCLVPKLPPSELDRDGEKDPLLAIQITVFPGCGICMGFALRPVVADGRTFDNFLKMWASFTCKNGGEDLQCLEATHDRSVMHDPSGLESTFLKEWWKIKNSEKEGFLHSTRSKFPEMVRSTFVLGKPEMEKIKKWILTRSEKLYGIQTDAPISLRSNMCICMGVLDENALAH
ncbi:Coumaroyl-CoA:anthocyanidin 3-O-glucoside-6''-O-coumaroyltransferase 1 [Forsythia ovata]|uniref:Coumaroyl-CoA:anthocyanidin 3-O-glucoside-6''-O-coumaroyltransferase 1 n=1 Tax=Forsythia ovata TaxID=205694 RepID=A0ABD1R4B0_9LAMI